MPTITALQHLYGPVPRDFFPEEGGSGHQTISLSEKLIGTDDLKALEQAACYALSPREQALRAKPVKKTFFRLPSGSYAIGKTFCSNDLGPGDELVYLAHHLVVARETLANHRGHPFSVLDIAEWVGPDMDLTPRTLPLMVLEVPEETDILLSVVEPRRTLLSALAPAVVSARYVPILLLGDENRSLDLLRVVFRALPLEERMALTFSTHFYQSEALRNLFSVVTLATNDRTLPGERYLVFNVDTGELPPQRPVGAYANWLSKALDEGAWEQIDVFNNVLNELRAGGKGAGYESLKSDARTRTALLERAGLSVQRALSGEPKRIAEFLGQVPVPQPLADALLNATPDSLFGSDSPEDDVRAALSVLQRFASKRAWSRWWQRWKSSLVLAPHRGTLNWLRRLSR